MTQTKEVRAYEVEVGSIITIDNRLVVVDWVRHPSYSATCGCCSEYDFDVIAIDGTTVDGSGDELTESYDSNDIVTVVLQ